MFFTNNKHAREGTGRTDVLSGDDGGYGAEMAIYELKLYNYG